MQTSSSETSRTTHHQSPSAARESITHPQPQRLPTVRLAISAMRPKQWTKNGLVLLALVFSHRLFDLAADARAMLAFAVFCLAASAIYIFNDIYDREKDAIHPTKRLRPIASGRLSVRDAHLLAAGCVSAAIAGTAVLTIGALSAQPDPYSMWGGSPLLFTLTVLAYLGMNVLYTLRLKHEVLWDVFIIAGGFVLRALAGAIAIPVPISPWFYLCTTFLALFLALGKRRAELTTLSESAAQHRPNLRDYNTALLDQLLGITVTSVLITYSLYTFQGENASHALMLTIPFVLFGTYRYLYLIYARGEGGQPDVVLYRDRQILATVILCIVVILALLYLIPAMRG